MSDICIFFPDQAETICELQNLLDESKGALEAANEKLTSRDIQILDLQTGSEELQGSHSSYNSTVSTSQSLVSVSDCDVSAMSLERRDIGEYFVDDPRGCEREKVLRLVITPVKSGKLVPKQTKASLLRLKGSPTKGKAKVKRKINASDNCPTPGSAAKRQRMAASKTKRVSVLAAKTTLTRTRHMSGKANGSIKYNLRTRR